MLAALLWATQAAAAPLPWPGLRRYKARDLDCERLEAGVASRRYPGVVDPPYPKGDRAHREALICRQRLLRPGLRGAATEALLQGLQDHAVGVAGAVRAEAPALEGRTWLVEAHLAEVAVGAKVRFATLNALMAEGLVVSDRLPVWSAGDVRALSALPGAAVLPEACARMHALGQLGPDTALLALTQLDRRETGLHAGVCADGAWTWLP